MSVDDNRNTSDDGQAPPPSTKPTIRRRWRYFSRRHAFLAGIIIGVGILALILFALIAYRFGFVDRYVAGQITSTFANYGIRATIKEFHSSIPPRTVEMSDVELFDAVTGEQLGKIDKLSAKLRITDLYALNLRTLAGVGVDGQEQIRVLAVGDGCALLQRDVFIGIARQDGLDAGDLDIAGQIAELRGIGAGEHEGYSRHRPRLGEIDNAKARVRVRGSQHHRLEHALRGVVGDVAAGAPQQRIILLPSDRLTDSELAV